MHNLFILKTLPPAASSPSYCVSKIYTAHSLYTSCQLVFVLSEQKTQLIHNAPTPEARIPMSGPLVHRSITYYNVACAFILINT